MSKRLNHIFYEKSKFKNMLEAYERATKNKHKNKEVILYKMDLASKIVKVLKQLYNNTYMPSKYRSFRIYEPKERLIQALPLEDRIVQQWYVEEFIKPVFIPKFIQDTYACIEQRGVHGAVKKLKKYMYVQEIKTKEYYILKCDVSKFFYSISKEKLYKIIEKSIKDKEVLALTKLLIYSDDSPIGIPIGNYTSQYFANIYLNELDHYIKEELKIKYYVRYMDDFVLLLPTKEEAKKKLKQIQEYLNKKLELTLNRKTNYFKSKQGVNFCGFKVFSTHILLKKDNKKKIYKRVKQWNKQYQNKQLNIKEAAESLQAWIGHASNADSYYLIKKVKDSCEWLYK